MTNCVKWSNKNSTSRIFKSEEDKSCVQIRKNHWQSSINVKPVKRVFCFGQVCWYSGVAWPWYPFKLVRGFIHPFFGAAAAAAAAVVLFRIEVVRIMV